MDRAVRRGRAGTAASSDTTADIVIVGAGIAGIATAFFALRATTGSVMLVERDRVARGASGRNAGQLTTYFERPLCAIADEFGWEQAAAAQRDVEGANDLLDLMVAETAAQVRVERFPGHMGMFNRHHLAVHLRCMSIRERGGLRQQTCVVSEDADYLADLPAEFASLYSVVPQSRVRELLEVDDDRYSAVLTAPAGTANSGLLCQQVLAHLIRTHGERFLYADCTNVDRVVVDDEGVVVHAGGRRVTATHVALCTNGFVDHRIEDAAGSPIFLAPDQQITGRRRLHDRLRRGSQASSGGNQLRPQRHDRRRQHRRQHTVRVRHATHLRPGCRDRDPDVHGRPGVGP